MRIVQAACNIFVDNQPFAWRADWSWGLALIVLTVLFHVSGLMGHKTASRSRQCRTQD
jgi:hypothetical protein